MTRRRNSATLVLINLNTTPRGGKIYFIFVFVFWRVTPNYVVTKNDDNIIIVINYKCR